MTPTPADVSWWIRRSLLLRYMCRSFERFRLGSRKWTWSCKKQTFSNPRYGLGKPYFMVRLTIREGGHPSQPDHKHLWKFWPFPPSWNMILWCSKHIPLINIFQVGGQVDESEASVLLGGLGGDGEHSFFSYLIIALVVLAALACCCCSYAVIELWWFDNHADMITEWDVL